MNTGTNNFRRWISLTVCEENQHGRQMRLCVEDDLVHDFEELLDLPAPGVVELILNADEEDNAEGVAATDRAHDNR